MGLRHRREMTGACRQRRWILRFVWTAPAALSLWVGPTTALAQAQDQWGIQFRANAVSRMTVLAVQQAIDSLPPMAGQASSYEYNASTDTYVWSPVLGPTALRSPRPIGDGRFAVRLSTSYFDISHSFEPAIYQVEPKDSSTSGPHGFAGFGLDAHARAGVIDLSVSYGMTPELDVSLALPMVIVDTSAKQPFTTRASNLSQPARGAEVNGGTTATNLRDLLAEGKIVYRSESFRALGYSFNEGTHVGLGRVSLGARAVLHASRRARIAFAPEIYLPSPNQDQYAGPDSFSFLPRLVGEAVILDPLRWIVEGGYEYDVDQAALRRAVAASGFLLAYRRFSIDAGVSASVYDAPIEWTPRRAVVDAAGYPILVISTADDNQVGDDFVDFIGGLKLRVSEQLVLSGAVTVPLNDQGFRPKVLGTIGIEVAL